MSKDNGEVLKGDVKGQCGCVKNDEEPLKCNLVYLQVVGEALKGDEGALNDDGKGLRGDGGGGNKLREQHSNLSEMDICNLKSALGPVAALIIDDYYNILYYVQ